ENEESLPVRGQKRVAPKGSTASSSKRGRKLDTSSIHRKLMNIDDDEDEDDMGSRIKKVQSRVTRNYGAIRR
ncbi:hypothetical protein IFM89_035052, partial [Coptis chinensis]